MRRLRGSGLYEARIRGEEIVPLTARELEILAMVTEENLTNKEIALRIGRCTNTAKYHVAALLRKHGVKRRSDLILLAKRQAESARRR